MTARKRELLFQWFFGAMGGMMTLLATAFFMTGQVFNGIMTSVGVALASGICLWQIIDC